MDIVQKLGRPDVPVRIRRLIVEIQSKRSVNQLIVAITEPNGDTHTGSPEVASSLSPNYSLVQVYPGEDPRAPYMATPTGGSRRSDAPMFQFATAAS